MILYGFHWGKVIIPKGGKKFVGVGNDTDILIIIASQPISIIPETENGEEIGVIQAEKNRPTQWRNPYTEWLAKTWRIRLENHTNHRATVTAMKFTKQEEWYRDDNGTLVKEVIG